MFLCFTQQMGIVVLQLQLAHFLGRTHAKKTHRVLNTVGFFTLSFSHVKKQMKT